MIIVERDGEFCKFCGRSPPEVKLVIDHKDNDNSNNFLGNLQLACRSCNYKKNPRRPLDMCERKSDSRFDSISINQAKKPKFREYVYGELEGTGRAFWEDLVNAGAEYVGVSIETAKRYMIKMVSKVGKLEMVPTFSLGMAVRYKKPKEFQIFKNYNSSRYKFREL